MLKYINIRIWRRVFFVTFFALFIDAYAQHGGKRYLSVMSFNCENAFDTIHDAGKDDYDFMPDGSHHWSRWRMYKKLKGIMKIMAAADETYPVDLVGLCEVENDSVMTWLLNNTAMHRLPYRYVMTSSEDKRGIDVALIYSRYFFQPFDTAFIRTSGLSAPVRDVLRVSGTVPTGDTLDVYVCHLPSKLGGREAYDRGMSVARNLKADVDSIMSVRSMPYVILMGDFNADYSSSLMRKVLGVKVLRKKTDVREFSSSDLVDLVAGKPNGSYKYHGQWSIIDHIIVSGTFFGQESRLHTSFDDSGIHAFPFLLEDDMTYGGKKPKRTYIWTKYNGGVSDHLPVWARFRF
ncbi:MAG: endonuclease/exonuclease/phosphatase family protein [Bacteroidaceae bacterium]|nr:endonuclease/exonuclease/phosphatase family protein [Bacteroidaceae bacterium]